MKALSQVVAVCIDGGTGHTGVIFVKTHTNVY